MAVADQVIAHNSQSVNKDSKRGIASVNHLVIAGSPREFPATTLTSITNVELTREDENRETPTQAD